MTYDLPAPSATSPSGVSAYWGGTGWEIKVLPDPHTSQPRVVTSGNPQVSEPATFAEARAFSLSLLAAMDHCEKHTA